MISSISLDMGPKITSSITGTVQVQYAAMMDPKATQKDLVSTILPQAVKAAKETEDKITRFQLMVQDEPGGLSKSLDFHRASSIITECD